MLRDEQEATCRRFDVQFLETSSDQKLGVALQTIGRVPINGLRHKPDRDACGWYIWCGEELSNDDGFFQPMHVSHSAERLPEVLPYLSLAPGWRFLIAQGHEDVWFDESLLNTAP